MRRATSIQQDVYQIHTVEDLTEVFEGIASMRIAKLRDRVVASKDYFTELWQTYSSLRIDPRRRMREGRKNNQRDALIAVTAEGKLSGAIDEQIITALLQEYKNPATTDIIVIGAHGLSQLQQANVPVARAFHLPPKDEAFNVTNVIEALNNYRQLTAFYQTYESLRVQKVARIELVAAVRALGEVVGEGDQEIVSSADYIFEPDLNEIANYMESVMMGVALIQVVTESKLAQYASRFNAMSSAKKRAGDLLQDMQHQFYRAKRAESDERLKETIKIIRHQQRSTL